MKCGPCVYNSAKVTDENEITPQSNYIWVFNDGRCKWDPRFDLSVSRCPVEVTWFPFDVQKCDLIFESWLLQDSVLDIDAQDVHLFSSVNPDAWYVTGVYITGVYVMQVCTGTVPCTGSVHNQSTRRAQTSAQANLVRIRSPYPESVHPESRYGYRLRIRTSDPGDFQNQTRISMSRVTFVIKFS